jgi:hypothetical protein
MLLTSGQIYRPVYKSYRLNERMYGALEGKSKVRACSLSALCPVNSMAMRCTFISSSSLSFPLLTLSFFLLTLHSTRHGNLLNRYTLIPHCFIIPLLALSLCSRCRHVWTWEKIEWLPSELVRTCVHYNISYLLSSPYYLVPYKRKQF